MNREEFLKDMAMIFSEWPWGPGMKASRFGLVSYSDWLAERERLINKPSWADAPDWATHLLQEPGGAWYWIKGFVRILEQLKGWESGRSEFACEGAIPPGHDWRQTLEQRPDSTDVDQPDWSQAPTGATHWGPRSNGYEQGWFKSDLFGWKKWSPDLNEWAAILPSHVGRVTGLVARANTDSPYDTLPADIAEKRYDAEDEAFRECERRIEDQKLRGSIQSLIPSIKRVDWAAFRRPAESADSEALEVLAIENAMLRARLDNQAEIIKTQRRTLDRVQAALDKEHGE